MLEAVARHLVGGEDELDAPALGNPCLLGLLGDERAQPPEATVGEPELRRVRRRGRRASPTSAPDAYDSLRELPPAAATSGWLRRASSTTSAGSASTS